jgi:hypothetical protein
MEIKPKINKKPAMIIPTRQARTVLRNDFIIDRILNIQVQSAPAKANANRCSRPAKITKHPIKHNENHKNSN